MTQLGDLTFRSGFQELPVVAHICSSRTWEAQTEGSQVQSSLGYLVRPCLNVFILSSGFFFFFFQCVCVQANLKRHCRFECRHSSKANCDVRAGCALMPAFGRRRQEDLSEFQDSQDYIRETLSLGKTKQNKHTYIIGVN